MTTFLYCPPRPTQCNFILYLLSSVFCLLSIFSLQFFPLFHFLFPSFFSFLFSPLHLSLSILFFSLHCPSVIYKHTPTSSSPYYPYLSSSCYSYLLFTRLPLPLPFLHHIDLPFPLIHHTTPPTTTTLQVWWFQYCATQRT